MRSRAITLAMIGSIVGVALFACGDDGGASPNLDAGLATDASADADAGSTSDTGVADADAAAPQTILVRTSVAATSTTKAARANASWAAYAEGTGAWKPLPAAATGSYSFTSGSASWSVALVCNDDANAASTVMVFRRKTTTNVLDVTLDDDCRVPAGATYTIDGNLTNVPATTGWFDFGYPLGSRGTVTGTTGTSAAYEVVNVAAGTWDLLFGVRDDAFLEVTKIGIVRGKAITGTATFDVDLGGANGAVPELEPIVIHGVTADASFEPKILFTTGVALRGLPMHPGATPPPSPDVSFSYATVPSALKKSNDSYRLDLTASRNSDTELRAAIGWTYTAMAIDVTLPPALAAPTTTTVASTPYPRLATTVALPAGTVIYEVDHETTLTPRSHRRWRASVDASLGATDTLPDLSTVSGFDTTWGLAAGRDVSVRAAVHDAPAKLGDGLIEHVATTVVTFTP